MKSDAVYALSKGPLEFLTVPALGSHFVWILGGAICSIVRAILFFKCLRCFLLGRSIKLYVMGIMSNESKNIAMMFIEATTPNSLRILLLVKIKVANPEAVVKLVIKVAFPIFAITRCKDLAWFRCLAISCWYLLIKKIQFGTPITIIKGGIKAVSTVISYPNHPSIPKAHITPIATTIREMNVARKDRKNKKKIRKKNR